MHNSKNVWILKKSGAEVRRNKLIIVLKDGI